MWLGEKPPLIPTVCYVTTAEQALKAVKAGETAMLPAGAWDVADDVLHQLGLGPLRRAELLRFARFNVLRAVPQGVPDPVESPRVPTRMEGLLLGQRPAAPGEDPDDYTNLGLPDPWC